ncbi:hypothetical protein DFP73DRAFT_565771, partial [Morchella snyderi]
MYPLLESVRKSEWLEAQRTCTRRIRHCHNPQNTRTADASTQPSAPVLYLCPNGILSYLSTGYLDVIKRNRCTRWYVVSKKSQIVRSGSSLFTGGMTVFLFINMGS